MNHRERPAATRKRQLEVALVSMPFFPLEKPSIGLSLLKAGLLECNVSAKVLYLSTRFAKQTGAARYTRIAQGWPLIHNLLGEWIFSSALFPAEDLDAEGYLETVFHGGSPYHRTRGLTAWAPSEDRDRFLTEVFDIREKVNAFLDRSLEEVLSYRPRIVGFTSVFQQQVASLALAKRIKMASPETSVVFGGANCEGRMGVEVVRQFPFVDAVVSGEGDQIFPTMVERVLRGEPVSDLQGVLTRDSDLDSDRALLGAGMVRDMDALPYPDYDDFFEQLEASGLETEPIEVMYETSRGCWWGEKQHCTFCGLNGLTMTFRSKSQDRALKELIHLREKYPASGVMVVDNILDMQYLKDFVPELAKLKLDLRLYYEVKSNLRKDQLELMRDAGITWIQPGIESLNSHVLKLMRKGVKAIQNIQLLKWCGELGIVPNWNLIWGFPGESADDYRQMANLIPRLTHLPPPIWATDIRLDRFSPNFNQADEFGFTAVKPYPAYSYIYPLPPETVSNLAYFFSHEYEDGRDVASYVSPLIDQVKIWKETHERSVLYWIDKGSDAIIVDLRPGADKMLSVTAGVAKTLFASCGRARSITQLDREVNVDPHHAVPAAEIEEHLEQFVERGLMIREDDLYLNLAMAAPERRSNGKAGGATGL